MTTQTHLLHIKTFFRLESGKPVCFNNYIVQVTDGNIIQSIYGNIEQSDIYCAMDEVIGDMINDSLFDGNLNLDGQFMNDMYWQIKPITKEVAILKDSKFNKDRILAYRMNGELIGEYLTPEQFVNNSGPYNSMEEWQVIDCSQYQEFNL